MKNLLKTVSLAALCVLSFNLVLAQNSKDDKKAAKAAETNRIISGKNYIFKANYVLPLSGGGKALTSEYDVTISKGKMVVYLPYFGRAYTAPMDATDGGIKLNTTNFDYKAVPGKKGTWEIVIKPTDKNLTGSKDINSLRLIVGSDLSASLRVISLNRDPISFNGTVEEIKKEVK